MADLTAQEYHSQVKEIVDGGWKHLLANAIIRNSMGNNFSRYGPVLTGGLCFDHQNTRRSDKWSHFSETSFVLPRVQFSHERDNTYITFNTVITNSTQLEQEMQLIDSEIISSLELCHQLLNGQKQHADDITNITNGDFEKVMLAHETDIETNLQNMNINVGRSLMRLSSMHPSSYLFGVLRSESCLFGATAAPMVRLFENQVDITANNLMTDFIRDKLKSIIETNSLVVSDKPTPTDRDHPQYLYTSVCGTIRTETTLLDLIHTLHPTPAVSGFTQSNALKFIQENEHLDRGWFAAPIGWIDAYNNGEFVVTSTSVLMNEGSTSLFTGCDVVADTDPEDKLQETILKMKAMLSAFGEK